MRYKISKSQPLPKQKEHRSVYDQVPIEKLPVGGNFLIEKIAHTKGQSKDYMKKYSAIRNGMLISASQKRVKGIFSGDVRTGVTKNDKDPSIKEIRVFRVM